MSAAATHEANRSYRDVLRNCVLRSLTFATLGVLAVTDQLTLPVLIIGLLLGATFRRSGRPNPAETTLFPMEPGRSITISGGISRIDRPAVVIAPGTGAPVGARILGHPA